MKNKVLIPLLAALLTVTLSSCEKNYYQEPEPDVKAMKIESVGSVFTAMARQPEAADMIVAAAEKTLFASYTDLLPLNDRAVAQRGAARGVAIGQMVEALARQPEMGTTLDNAGMKFLGEFSKGHISAEMNEYARAAASPYVSESIAHQPEIEDAVNELLTKYLGI